MATKDQLVTGLLSKLRSALGTGEDPDGSNHNFITVWYNENVDKIGNGPWCEMTVTWAMWTSGLKSLKKGRAYTVYGAQDGQHGENGSSFHYGTAGMQAGDQVYYDWNGSRDVSRVDHTGVVERIVGDGTFYTLEGNTSNHLERKLRDGKYVVGYVRFAWDRLSTTPVPSPHPETHPHTKPTHGPDSLVVNIQKLLKVDADGKWGPHTDSRALLMREAARAKVGYPRNTGHVEDIRVVQNIVSTPVDGVWGPKSQAQLVRWVKQLQHNLKVEVDGRWGPKTDDAFLKTRKKNLNQF